MSAVAGARREPVGRDFDGGGPARCCWKRDYLEALYSWAARPRSWWVTLRSPKKRWISPVCRSATWATIGWSSFVPSGTPLVSDGVATRGPPVERTFGNPGMTAAAPATPTAAEACLMNVLRLTCSMSNLPLGGSRGPVPIAPATGRPLDRRKAVRRRRVVRMSAGDKFPGPTSRRPARRANPLRAGPGGAITERAGGPHRGSRRERNGQDRLCPLRRPGRRLPAAARARRPPHDRALSQRQTTPSPSAIDFVPGALLGSVSGELGLRRF